MTRHSRRERWFPVGMGRHRSGHRRVVVNRRDKHSFRRYMRRYWRKDLDREIQEES